MKLNKREWIALTAGLLFGTGAALYLYQRSSPPNSFARRDLLELMPADASAIFSADLTQLRSARFLEQVYAWAPQSEPDEDYTKFLNETGFDYQRDLNRVAMAFQKTGQDSTFFAVAEGRFDQQKISAVALKSGTVERRGGREIFEVPESGGARKITFVFLSKDRIALTDRPNLGQWLSAKKRDDLAEWQTRFERLAGSPIFAVIRQDAAAGEALSSQAPGGFSSPQLSTILDELQWITIAGKPENDGLRVVAEGESSSEETTRQLADLLTGVLSLAEAGLNDAKTRQQLNPALREAYLGLLKGADVSRLDRGDTKSVRITFEITAAFLESAKRSAAGATRAAPANPAPGDTAHAKKGGHT
ncbi:MAG TPA: hypothetical protein VHM93_17420 [Candidatus Acidoferrum sp.]|jgi:hypothetical protein|nr:hypothetical protein [Candidatus Acidoferrum sp.]